MAASPNSTVRILPRIAPKPVDYLWTFVSTFVAIASISLLQRSGGHLLASLIGVAIYKFILDQLWLSSALAVSLSIVGMQITKTMHPPAGTTALITNIGSEKIKSLGFGYTLTPVLTGVTILLFTALIINNIPTNRSYPVRSLSWSQLVNRWYKRFR